VTGRRGTDGFTLMEMMVVIVVMGLLLGLVLTRGPERSPMLELRAAASQVAQGLRLARTEAIAADQPVRFTLDPARHGFVIDGKTHTLPPEIAIAAPKAGIIFMPDGSASRGMIRLGLGKLRMAIKIHWLTGHVDILPG
jgi:general secretion pathway protein H